MRSPVRGVAVLTIVTALVAACSPSPGGASPVGSASAALNQSPSPAPSSGGSAAAAIPTTINYRFDWTPTALDIPILAAEKFGYFKEGNLTVVTTTGSGSTDSVTLTGAGTHDIAIADALATTVAVEHGIPIISIGVPGQHIRNGIISLKSKPVNSAQDLIGKRFGTQAGSSSQLFYQALLKKAGVDRKQITEVPRGFGIEPLIQGQIDAEIDFYSNEFVLADQASNGNANYVDLSTFGIDPYSQTIIANKAFLAAHPDAVKAFLRAYAKGQEWALKNPDEAIELLKPWTKASDAYLKQAMPLALGFYTSDDTATKGLLYSNMNIWRDQVIALAVESALIKQPIDPTQVATNDYLPDPPILAAPGS